MASAAEPEPKVVVAVTVRVTAKVAATAAKAAVANDCAEDAWDAVALSLA